MFEFLNTWLAAGWWVAILLIVVGCTALIKGAGWLVDGASGLAKEYGISDIVIGLTVVAFGTSLPELVTTITAARKDESELLVGNIIGSNIFNICVVLGVPVAIFGTIQPDSFEAIDIVMLLGSTVLLWLCARKGSPITRREGILMLMVFALYYGYIIYGALA